MIQHNLLLLYRNFLRSKGYFAINLFGLSAGLACTLLIYLWVREELRMDRFHEKDARLFEVMENQLYADHIMTTTSTPGVLAEALRDEVPEIEHSIVTTWVSSYTLSIKERNVKAKGFHAEKDFFNMFSYPLVEGQPEKVLEDKFAMVISQSLAKQLFGDEVNVVGKIVELQHSKTFHVTGVFKDIPSTSTTRPEFVMNWEEYKGENEWVKQWGNNGPPTYVLLREGSHADAVTTKIKDFIMTKKKEGTNVSLFLKPYSEMYLYGHYENGVQAGGRIEYVRLFSIIAIFILAIACINFMNLATARASRRAKEVGIKKSVGAQRKSLIFQYITESLATAFLSLLIAVMIVWLLLPQFNLVTQKDIHLNLDDANMVFWFVTITTIAGLLAGSYPALYLSGFRPAEVLKGEVRGSWGELWARKGLVVFQFALSVILIVGVLVIYQQVEYVQTKNLGYKKDHLIHFPVEGKVSDTRETFLTEIRRIPGVVSAGTIGHSLMGRNNNTSDLEWEGKDPQDEVLFENFRMGPGMMETLGLEMAEGRSFSVDSFASDSSAIIINESALRIIGYEDPIGKNLKLWDKHDLKIIGIVKDFHFQSLHEAVNPCFLVANTKYTWNVMVRLESGKEKETLQALSDFYKTYNPGFTLEYTFQDEDYARLYAAEQRVATLSGYFAAFAILISCLGLFGLAAFTAERRLKEIGIRKALGSSSVNIVLLLSKDFTRMVLMSIAVGLPLSYWLLGEWLKRFAFHVELQYWYFGLAGVLALLVAWITVASQAIKASNVNPVECLRDQ